MVPIGAMEICMEICAMKNGRIDNFDLAVALRSGRSDVRAVESNDGVANSSPQL